MNNYIIYIFILICIILLFIMYPLAKVCYILFFDRNKLNKKKEINKEKEINIQNEES